MLNVEQPAPFRRLALLRAIVDRSGGRRGLHARVRPEYIHLFNYHLQLKIVIAPNAIILFDPFRPRTQHALFEW